MSWSNWIYLAVGLGLGLGSRWLLKQSQGRGASLAEEQGRKETLSPHPSLSQDANQDGQALLSQLKQTQLAYQLAHQMSQFKAGFLVRTAHELRSPLNSLIGLHQLILSDLCDDPAEEREFVAQAHESALKLINLMDEVLGVARIEHGTNQLEIQPLELAQMLEEVYNLTHLLAAHRNFSIQLLPSEPEIYILADPRWLRQVLVNLVDTCIAQIQEGSICVSAEPIPVEESAHILLDVQLPASAWAEPVDLMESEHKLSEPIKDNTALSPGMTLLLNQTLLEVMKGRLEILPISTDAGKSDCTRIQITIPLVIPETASLEQEAN